MTNNIDPITEQELHAYIDGGLSEHRIHAVENFLAHNPTELAKVKDYQKLNQLLSTRHRQILNERIPRAITSQTPRIGIRAKSIPLLIAASVVWAFIGGIVG